MVIKPAASILPGVRIRTASTEFVPNLDFFTLNVAVVANLLLSAAVLLLVSQLETGSRGIRRSGVSCLALSAAFGLNALRTVIAGKALLLLINFSVFGSSLLLLDGIMAFRGRKRPSALFLVLSASFTALFCWFFFAQDDFNARVAVDSFFIGLIAWIAASTMATNVPRSDRIAYWTTAGGMALHGTAVLARGVLALVHPAPPTSPPGAIDLIAGASLSVAALACAFGFAMAANLDLQRRTARLALYDPLTNLPNRRLFEERLEQADRRAAQGGQRLALIYCDLDDFKDVNDSLGHSGGDEALKLVATRLRSVLSADVCLARIGGDEFVVLVENAPARDSMKALMNRLLHGVDGDAKINGKTVQLRISCGLAMFPEDVQNASDLIRLADAGMYSMKQRGRFSPQPQLN